MISLENISIRQARFELHDVSLHVPSGAYGVLMGQTGSGKTTLLECVVGFRRLLSGRVKLYDQDVTTWNPAIRGVGYVPQEAALFSRMPVGEQLGFALKIRSVPRLQRQARVAEVADLLGITDLLDRKPQRLSGGEKQRVALGRALAFNPRVLCLDEPLSALDSSTRQQMCQLLSDIKKTTGVTTLHITHNEQEAVELADCVFRLQDGKLLTES